MANEPLAFSQNNFVPAQQLSIAPGDAGFVWGATITDLCRTFSHRLFRLPDHLARFRRSCQAANIQVPLGDVDMIAAAEKLVEHNARFLTANQELILVLLATPGLIGFYGGDSRPGPTFIMHTYPLPFARYRHLFSDGARLLVSRIPQIPAACVDPRIKHRSRMHWWLAEQEVHQKDPGASALLLDEAGFVTETAIANFLLVRNRTLYSPRLSTILNGVSLQVVREFCGQLGIAFAERDLSPDEFARADEALLTNTAFCVAGVRSINGLSLPWPGPVLARLLRHWSEVVGLDVRAQICP